MPRNDKFLFFFRLNLMHFSDRLAATIKQKNSCLMLGLDPNWDRIPDHLKTGDSNQEKADTFERFCCDMTDACAEFICGVKPQLGYFEALGSVGIKALENVLAHVRTQHPDLIILLDAKRGDIGSTSEAYAQAFLGEDSPLAGDCVTVAPYMGIDSVKPFDSLAIKYDKGVFILAKTSNESSFQVQDARLEDGETVAERWCTVMEFVSQGRKNPNRRYSHLGAVVGATHAAELPKFREILKSCWMLCPGVGAQGGKLEDVLKIRDEDGLGVIIPVSRSVLYASGGKDYLEAAAAAMKELWEGQKI